MLDLQETYQRGVVGDTSDNLTHISGSMSPTLNFAPTLGSLATRLETQSMDTLDSEGGGNR